MAKFRLFGRKTDEESQRERDHRALARRVAAEGMVLLKNDGVLPMTPGRIALFGAGARFTVKGGTGSGDVQERYSVNVEQGLKNAGFAIASARWLDRFDRRFSEEKEAWRLGIEERIKGYAPWNVQKMFDEVIHVTPLRFPIGDEIQPEDMDDADAAIYVLARQAGESTDRRLQKGDYLLSDIEAHNIKVLASKYKKFLLVLNCGSPVDLSDAENIVPGILFMAQGGEEGGNAFADLISGEVTPSGKLTDTWACKYQDYPASGEYGVLGNVLEQDYKEGIYVGYRYFDTFGVKPRYCFGHGLSYTDFEISAQSIHLYGTTVTAEIEVTNTGRQYGGKETVQIYLSKPQSELHCEKHTLCAFAKTRELKPTESEKLTLCFDVRDFAAYNEQSASWLLPGGKYGVFVGNSIENIKPVAVIVLTQTVITEKCKNISTKRGDFEELHSKATNESYEESLPALIIDAEKVACRENTYGDLTPIISSDRTKEYLDTLSDEDLIELTVGGGYTGLGYNVVPTVAGRTSINLLKKGIPEINLTDGPAGLHLYPKNAYTKLGIPNYVDHLPENWQWGWMKKLEPFVLAKPGKGLRVYQYMTAFPCATLQAQTWDPNLIEEVGEAIGVEMIETGCTLWLAPGMNIHRNPLCGRNFEYYSEDPLLSGVFAAAVTKGVQSHKGVGTTIKHFCCNNQEDKRTHMSSNVSERALREIYLKGFAYAVKNSHPKAIMTGYNKLNGVYMPNNYDLCVSVLRNEWGYEGLVMTDWTSTGDDKGKHMLCHKCGNDLIEPGGKSVKKELIKAYRKAELDMGKIRVCAANVLNVVFDSNVID